MNISPGRIIPVYVVLGTLCVCALPAAAQDASRYFDTPNRKSRINTSSEFVDDAGIQPDTTQEAMLALPKAYSTAFVGSSLSLTWPSLQESGNPGPASTSSLKLGAENEQAAVESTDPPVQRFVSRLNHGLYSPPLYQGKIANILADLRKKYGAESLTQWGNFHWSIAWQRTLASDKKTANLVACNKMSRWSSICASADANTYSVYFKGS